MAFSRDVAQKILVATARHCALCHKYCGTKIELHHIVPKSEGGDDSEDNCIPLCFDCHADVEHYNSSHPRGRKLTPAELREHRDRWFVRNSAGADGVEEEEYGEVHAELDKTTYKKLRELLPSEGSISFLRVNNYAGHSFPLNSHKQLLDFSYHCTDHPEFEFIDPDLEGLRADLRANADHFLDTLAENSWTVVADPDNPRNRIPPEWEYENPERFSSVVGTVHNLSSKITDGYDSLVRLARRRLGVGD